MSMMFGKQVGCTHRYSMQAGYCDSTLILLSKSAEVTVKPGFIERHPLETAEDHSLLFIYLECRC